MFDAAVCERAVELLREHLSPEQLDQYNIVRGRQEFRMQFFPSGKYKDFVGHSRWFNVTGTLGNTYTVFGCVSEGDDPGWSSHVAAGHDKKSRDWCVYARGLDRSPQIPVGDQMLAFKLVLENSEQEFLMHAVPITQQAHQYRTTTPQAQAVMHPPPAPFIYWDFNNNQYRVEVR